MESVANLNCLLPKSKTMFIITRMDLVLIEVQMEAESTPLVDYLELSPFKIMEHGFGK